MVALNTAYAPSKTSTRSKNRVADFFCGVGQGVRNNRLASRIGTQGRSSYSYETASGLPVWPSRDPIGERGGLNLYGFINNAPIIYIDYLGQSLFFCPPSNVGKTNTLEIMRNLLKDLRNEPFCPPRCRKAPAQCFIISTASKWDLRILTFPEVDTCRFADTSARDRFDESSFSVRFSPTVRVMSQPAKNIKRSLHRSTRSALRTLGRGRYCPFFESIREWQRQLHSRTGRHLRRHERSRSSHPPIEVLEGRLKFK